MKKFTLFTLLALFGTCLSSQTNLIFNQSTQNEELVGLTYDKENEKSNIEKIDIKNLESTNQTVIGSQMFVQHGNDGEYDYLRYAVAVKGDIESISFTRSVPAYDSKNTISEVTQEVTTIYKGLSANGSTYYYNAQEANSITNGLTTDETYKNDYYWTCYSIRFETKTYKESPVTVSVNINDGEFTQNRSMTVNNLKNNITHEFFAIDENTNVTSPVASPKNTKENCVGSSSQGLVTIEFPIHVSDNAEANLFAAISSAGSNAYDFSGSYTFYINDVEQTVNAKTPTGALFGDYNSVDLGTFTLSKGLNNFKFTIDKSLTGVKSLNFRSLKFNSPVDLSWAETICESKCELCNGCLDNECDHDVCLTKCSCVKSTFSVLENSVIVSGTAGKTKDKNNECIGVSSKGTVEVTYSIKTDNYPVQVELFITMSRWTSERNIIRSSESDTAIHAYSLFINNEEQFSSAKTIITSDSSNANLKFNEFDEISLGVFTLTQETNTILLYSDFANTGKINVNFRSFGFVTSSNNNITLI